MLKKAELEIRDKCVIEIQHNPMLDIHVYCETNLYLHTQVSSVSFVDKIILLQIIIIYISHD